MKRISLILTALSGFALSGASAQDANKPQGQTMQVLHAVANNKSSEATLRELAMKDIFANRCDGQETCSHLLRIDFVVEVTYECRDATGSARQIGPNRFDGMQRIEMSCR